MVTLNPSPCPILVHLSLPTCLLSFLHATSIIKILNIIHSYTPLGTVEGLRTFETVRILKWWIKDKSPNLVFLMETKCDREKIEYVPKQSLITVLQSTILAGVVVLLCSGMLRPIFRFTHIPVGTLVCILLHM